MRRLLLFRHSKAERSEPGSRDISRTLIERGRKDAAKIGAYMAGHALIPDRVVVPRRARPGDLGIRRRGFPAEPPRFRTAPRRHAA